MTLPVETRASLRSLASAATTGARSVVKSSNTPSARFVVQCDNTGSVLATIERWSPEADEADANFIAAANPATVIALLDALDAAERERDAFKSCLPADVDPSKPCRCGSGAHPRQCERHPSAHQRHVNELNAETREIDFHIERIATWHDERRHELHGVAAQAPPDDRAMIYGQTAAHEYSAAAIRSGRAVPASKGESE